MLTEEEAKAKWCPFARSGNEAGCNRNGENGFAITPHCLGSTCMAWISGGETTEFKNKAETEFKRHGTRLIPTSADKIGFCGLAGKP